MLYVRVREVFVLLGVNQKEQRKAETNSRCPLQRGVSYERVDCNPKQFYCGKFLSAHSQIHVWETHNLNMMSVMCHKHDCKSLWCLAILKGQIKMTILLLRSLTNSGQIHGWVACAWYHPLFSHLGCKYVCMYVCFANFLKTNLTKFAVIWVKRCQKAGFLSLRSSKITVKKEKERRKRKSEENKRRKREKHNGCALCFYNSYVLWR